jgi:hypothetical protein
LLYELVGHLYFAEVGELDLPSIREFVERELQIDEVWLYLLDEMIGAVEQGLRPATQELGAWHCSQNIHVLKLLQMLQQRPAAFKLEDRRHQIKRIQLMYQQNKLREHIAFLKKQLLQATAAPAEDYYESNRRMLQEIALLNKKLYNIESLMQNS